MFEFCFNIVSVCIWWTKKVSRRTEAIVKDINMGVIVQFVVVSTLIISCSNRVVEHKDFVELSSTA